MLVVELLDLFRDIVLGMLNSCLGSLRVVLKFQRSGDVLGCIEVV